ncbi:hypothetical protein Pelo_4893 [Pelomyxa schiedti]|nr:hypothetical protein Pelo_4893 [Pelomyxa schiedti]
MDALLASTARLFLWASCLLLEETSDAATKAANSIDPAQLFSSCSRHSDLDRCSGEVNAFGNIIFGVDLGNTDGHQIQ